ncbi:MAG: DUF2922 domain-containing protein [Firmicutes bacterium]|nr:DUF2922 domain-containing protein [Bacillota bacterium]
MESTLQLVFRNEDGRLFTLSVPEPKEDLTEADVTGVMDLILAKNIFQTTGGALVSKVRARIVSRDSMDVAAFE